MTSLAGKFKIEGGEANGKGLEERAGESYIHVEGILAHSTELHVDVIVVVLVYQLEVFHRRFVHSPVEIQHKCLHLYTFTRY